MFGRKKDDDGAAKAEPTGAAPAGAAPEEANQRDRRDGPSLAANADKDAAQAPPLKPFTRRGSHAPAKPPSPTAYGLDAPRRAPDIPGSPGRRPAERPRASGELDSRRLVVGREIQLAGEIKVCDKLVVEGEVEVTMPNARALEVTSSGVFKGRAEVAEAEIAGRFEGDLIARDRLTVRSGGRIRGSVRYGNIVIENGGEIAGDMQRLGGDDEAAEAAAPDEAVAKR